MAETFNVGKKSVKGNVVNDPSEIDTPNGKLVAFRLADNKRFYDRAAQQWKDAKPTYYDVGINEERLQANVLASVERGQQVTVEGNHQVQAFTHKDGEPGIGHRLYATDVSPSLEWDTLQRQPAGPSTSETQAEAAAETQRQPEPAPQSETANHAPQQPTAPAPQPPQQQAPEPQTPEAVAIRQQAEQSWGTSQAHAGPSVD